ncbi:hypothetical protein ANN_23157 [Periplaneta americana]|uniref:Uncharacterized protein n=1 Tax=Periplaneta americana TaxID=6978 RepID=A0ABQ8SMC1_PERAM|nr:hypothetical protein ANN_23157 [Periplaneta americana]
MAGLCEGGNEPPGSLKAISNFEVSCGSSPIIKASRDYGLKFDAGRIYQLAKRSISDNAGEMSPGSNTESYPAFARIGLRENPGKNLNQVTCPDRDSNPGHLVLQPDALTVTPQWPAHSPDLSPLDFFLWGTVKDSVYQNILTTSDDMQQRIRQALCSFSQQQAGQSYGLSGNAFESLVAANRRRRRNSSINLPYMMGRLGFGGKRQN